MCAQMCAALVGFVHNVCRTLNPAPDAYYSISVLGLSSVLMRYMNHNFGHPSLAFDASGRVFPAGPPGRACRGASIT